MHTNVQKWVTPLSGYLKFYVDGYMDGASSTASIEEALRNERREILWRLSSSAPAVASSFVVGVWVSIMAVMTTFFSKVQGGMASARGVLDMSQIQLALPFLQSLLPLPPCMESTANS
ncbi:hypothetical protein CXB51_025686 [Gossypium anomalum]|uniref:Uncharacterized protein n=1 Tax=Gossypium anomalum TaxID=47600 RepID=A0A8J6CSN3_9ROSI|nr:hypothetical protein CXB51_025686 [Gossypium anomalum]